MARSALLLVVILFATVSCRGLPPQPERTPSRFVAATADTRLGKLVDRRLAEHPGENGIYSLLDGHEALVSRLRALAWADKAVDLQYYIWHDDLTGRLLMGEVLRAADRGVRVRLLMDDLNIGKHDELLAVLDAHPNIEVRMANPFVNRTFRFFDVFRFAQVNRRMHNKVLVADNRVAIMGGRNIGDEYFSASDGMNFGDFDLWIVGSTVADFSRQFDDYWNDEISYPVSSLRPDKQPTAADLDRLRARLLAAVEEAKSSPYADSLHENGAMDKFRPFPPRLSWGKARPIIDAPEKLHEGSEASLPENSIFHELTPHLAAVKREVILISPYFVPGNGGVEFYRRLVARGVRVVVLTNSLASNDVSTVFSGYRKYRKPLLEAGVELYELKPKGPDPNRRRKRLGIGSSQAGLHGKSIFFDRKKAFVGSLNMDNRSAVINSEMGLIFEDEEYASSFAKEFIDSLPDIAYRMVLDDRKNLRWESREGPNRTVLLDNEPETTWWKRFKAGVQALVVPEREL